MRHYKPSLMLVTDSTANELCIPLQQQDTHLRLLPSATQAAGQMQDAPNLSLKE